MKNMYDETPEYLQRKARSRQNKILLVVLVVIAVVVVWFISENDNMDETGYIGDWASYEYSDALRISEDGVYQYSALGDLSSGSKGLYKVYDDMNDIPTEYSSQIRRSYSVRDVKWIVLLDVVGNVFEFGYYDMNTDEIWMPDQFVRK